MEHRVIVPHIIQRALINPGLSAIPPIISSPCLEPSSSSLLDLHRLCHRSRGLLSSHCAVNTRSPSSDLPVLGSYYQPPSPCPSPSFQAHRGQLTASTRESARGVCSWLASLTSLRAADDRVSPFIGLTAPVHVPCFFTLFSVGGHLG